MVFRYRAPLYSEGAEIAKIAMESDTAQNVAKAILEKAQELARAAGYDEYADQLRIETGERPRGRPYIRVIADTDDASDIEFGDTGTERLRILGRAGNVVIFPDTK